LLVTFLTASAWPFPSGDKTDWPTWRGQKGDATLNATGVFDGEQSFALKVHWRQPLGPGYSSVSLAEGMAVTMFSDGTFDYAVAFDAEAGREIWRHQIDSTYVGHHGSHDGPISTPTISDGKVYLLGPRGQFLTLDLKSGEELWSVNLVEKNKAIVPFYGFSTSPVIHGDVAIVEAGGPESTVVGFDKNTGEVLWSTGNDTVSYQSPMVTTLQGNTQLLCVGDSFLYGLSPATGKTFWEYAYGGDKRAIGSASMNVVPAGDDRFFLTYKANESVMLRLNKESEEISVEEIWKNKNIRSSYNTPVYHDGYLYGYSNRFLTAVNAETGKVAWKSRAPGDGFTILIDDHLVIVTKKGGLYVAEATPEKYLEVASLKLFDEHAWSPASFAYGRFYARSMGHIAAIDIVPKDEMVASSPDDISKSKSDFSRFIDRVDLAANSASKAKLIDEFMKDHQQFPIIESENVVHFVYRGEANDISIQGDLLGARREEPLTRVAGTDFFYYTATLEPDARLSYRFVKDFEDTLIDSSNASDPVPSVWGNYSYLMMPKATMPRHLNPPRKSNLGRIDTVHFESKIFESSRPLDVYLPVGYDQSDAKYPVAYVHWGKQAQDWGKMKNTLDNILGETIRPVIAVFIPQLSQGRSRELSGDLKDNYQRMLIEELVPFVDQHYHTIPSAEGRATIGMGFGGIASLYSGFAHPEVFGKVASIGAVLFEDDWIAPVMRPASETPLQIYVDWGKYDWRSPLEAWDMAQSNRDFVALMQKKGYVFAGGEVNDGRGWANYRNRTDSALAALFPLQKTRK